MKQKGNKVNTNGKKLTQTMQPLKKERTSPWKIPIPPRTLCHHHHRQGTQICVKVPEQLNIRIHPSPAKPGTLLGKYNITLVPTVPMLQLFSFIINWGDSRMFMLAKTVAVPLLLQAIKKRLLDLGKIRQLCSEFVLL